MVREKGENSIKMIREFVGKIGKAFSLTSIVTTLALGGFLGTAEKSMADEGKEKKTDTELFYFTDADQHYKQEIRLWDGELPFAHLEGKGGLGGVLDLDENTDRMYGSFAVRAFDSLTTIGHIESSELDSKFDVDAWELKGSINDHEPFSLTGGYIQAEGGFRKIFGNAKLRFDLDDLIGAKFNLLLRAGFIYLDFDEDDVSTFEMTAILANDYLSAGINLTLEDIKGTFGIHTESFGLDLMYVDPRMGKHDGPIFYRLTVAVDPIMFTPNGARESRLLGDTSANYAVPLGNSANYFNRLPRVHEISHAVAFRLEGTHDLGGHFHDLHFTSAVFPFALAGIDKETLAGIPYGLSIGPEYELMMDHGKKDHIVGGELSSVIQFGELTLTTSYDVTFHAHGKNKGDMHSQEFIIIAGYKF